MKNDFKVFGKCMCNNPHDVSLRECLKLNETTFSNPKGCWKLGKKLTDMHKNKTNIEISD